MAPDPKKIKSNARMDAGKAAQLVEAIKKEQRIMRKFLAEQEKAGLIKPQEELSQATIEPQPVPPPALLVTVRGDPEAAMGLKISRNMWGAANPGYQLRDGFQLQSVMKQDYVWDQAEIDFMKEQHYLDKRFNRLRDEQSLFMEESCKFKHMGKHGGTAKVPGKT